MAITWMKYLETGIEWQDKQHKELFKKINDFQIAMEQKKGREEILKLIKFLDNYVVMHFGMEEVLMDRYCFMEADFHKAEHRKFKNNVALIKKEIEGGVDSLSMIKINDQAVDWIINHIGKTDKKLAEYLKTKTL